MIDAKTLKNRHRQIRDALAAAKVDCLVVTRPANVTYVTGFSGEDSWALVMPGGIILVTDSRYSEQARQECPGSPGCRIVVRKEAMFKTIAELLRNRPGLRIAVEKSTSIAEFENLKKHLKRRVGAVENIVETTRRTKDAGEIAAIRTAAKIASLAFENTRRRIKPGITENVLAGLLDFAIRKSGGRPAFETIVAFGPNASRPHHRPTSRKLRKNDTALIDFGVRFNGYCCDITRCFTIGRPGRLYERVYKAVQKAQSAAIKQIRAGVEIKKVDSAARKIIKDAGLPLYGHGTGHGLGLEVHEKPSISPKTQGSLQAGDIVTIEPAVYLPGKLGVRIEDDVLVTEKGPVLLSIIPKKNLATRLLCAGVVQFFI